MAFYPRYPYAYPDNTFLTANLPEPGDGVPIIPAAPNRASSPRLQPTVYQDEYGNSYYWQHGSPYVPAGFVPLPSSPSMLPTTYLPPSPRISPRVSPVRANVSLPAVPILPPNQLQPAVYYPQFYPRLDPYHVPQQYYHPAFARPTLHLHTLLKADSPHLLLDLSVPTCAALTPNGRHGVIPVHNAYLVQSATTPEVSKLTLTCPELAPFESDWSITVEHPSSSSKLVSVGDVLAAVHESLQTPITHMEWVKLNETEVYEVSVAYTRRCRMLGAADFERERNKGVRRCDFLRDKVQFAGMRLTKGDGTEFKMLVKAPKK